MTRLVHDAYAHYVPRLGLKPGPMREDYAEVIGRSRVTVAHSGSDMTGVIVLAATDADLLIENVAVSPAHRRRGLGRALLEFAEAAARSGGFERISLYTHEKMTENQDLYSKIGYVEYDRRDEGGFSRVLMRKLLT